MITVEDSVGRELLRNSKPGSAMYTYYYGRMEGDPKAFVPGDAEGFDRVLKEPKTLLYWSSFSPLGMKEFTALKTTDGIPVYLCWAFGKDSELTAFFNYHIRRVYEHGFWAREFHASLYTMYSNFLFCMKLNSCPFSIGVTCPQSPSS